MARGFIQTYPNLIDISPVEVKGFYLNARIHLSTVANHFKRADFDKIDNILKCMGLSGLELFENVSDALNHVYDISFAVMRACVPTHRINHSHYPYWFDREIISVINKSLKLTVSTLERGPDKQSRSYRHFL